MNTSLYIHMPWCIRKCPYCDFNSHTKPNQLPEEQYIQALINDFKEDISQFGARPIQSIFIGGGTPSLFSPKSYAFLFAELQKLVSFLPELEITLEANPGTFEQQLFREYRQVGINRLSLGIQSFNPKHLRLLGRIHDDNQAIQAIKSARTSGFDNINIDLMHGLPEQTLEEGLIDLSKALEFNPEHISWYQLTIEPNTKFYKHPPTLPNESISTQLEIDGMSLLSDSGFQRYEISAYCQNNRFSAHNLNYWQYGDFYGIGAGAHGKLTFQNEGLTILRTQKYRQPKDYLQIEKKFMADQQWLDQEEIIFEFMLNTSRLEQKISHQLFFERTGLPFTMIDKNLEKAASLGLVKLEHDGWQVTALGRQFTNNLQELFLPLSGSTSQA